MIKELKSLSSKSLLNLLPLVFLELVARVKKRGLRLIFYRPKPTKDKFEIFDHSSTFILDLRDSELELHRFSVLIQFFCHLGERYEIFQVWVNRGTFLFGGSRLYSKEAECIVELLGLSTKAQFLEKEASENIGKGVSYVYISNKGEAISHFVRSFFQDKLGFESLPIRYNYPLNYEQHPELLSLKKCLVGSFNIVFSPTFDLNLKVEPPSRKYGVISHANFEKLEKLYLDIQGRISREKITDIKIIFLNKKMLNWRYFPNVVDLRHFEDFGLDFASMLYFVQEHCNWTIGSEGTMQCYLMLSDRLKHAIFIDNSHWGYPASDGSTVPLFMDKCDYLDYKGAPYEYIPDVESVIDEIFKDYDDFRCLDSQSEKSNQP